MPAGLIIFLLIFLFIAGGLLAFWRSANSNLPDKMPPPLEDDEEDAEDK